MNFRRAVILATLAASLFPASNVLAQGNVLLPSDNPDKSNYPNLGLIPAEPPAPPAETPKPVEAPKIEKPPELPVATKPAIKTPAPTPNPSAVIQPYPSYTPPPAYRPQPMPYALTVALAASSSLTPNDINTVSDQLGIPKASVASQCGLGISGMLVTDRGTSTVDSKAMSSVIVPYGGAVTNAMLSVYAACNSAPKPAPYNYIQRIGDKYGVSLGNAFCAPKTPFSGTMRQVTVTHTSTGSDSCAYQ